MNARDHYNPKLVFTPIYIKNTITVVLIKGVVRQSAGGREKTLCILFIDEKVTLSTSLIKTRPCKEVRTG